MKTERPKPEAFPKWYQARTGGYILVEDISKWDILTDNGTLDSAFTECSAPEVPAFTEPEAAPVADVFDDEPVAPKAKAKS